MNEKRSVGYFLNLFVSQRSCVILAVSGTISYLAHEILSHSLEFSSAERFLYPKEYIMLLLLLIISIGSFSGMSIAYLRHLPKDVTYLRYFCYIFAFAGGIVALTRIFTLVTYLFACLK